jgi:3-deoxy-D-manno-octulosonic acid (KDO) 8-phosphate synthase
MSARKYFDDLYGHLNLSENDLAWSVFKTGYDCAQADSLHFAEGNWLKQSEQNILEQQKAKVGMRLCHD